MEPIDDLPTRQPYFYQVTHEPNLDDNEQVDACLLSDITCSFEEASVGYSDDNEECIQETTKDECRTCENDHEDGILRIKNSNQRGSNENEEYVQETVVPRQETTEDEYRTYENDREDRISRLKILNQSEYSLLSLRTINPLYQVL
mmetsp:Transcript_5895/g.12489  ORF Transcript_5895/g.12489 Transcript_5895/m.12489 type:complete len:146 (+) Transcript_5895:88-525(+)